jgi:hypothetical protein
MIYPDVPTEVWKKKYGLKSYVVNCKICHTSNSPDKPFVTFTSIGLFAESCYNCNSPLRLYTSVPRTEAATKEWDEIMSGKFL